MGGQTSPRAPKDPAVYKNSDLPIIDISPLAGGDETKKRQVAQALGDAACNVGFFYIAGHGVSGQLISAVHRQAASWFARPLAEKQRLYIGWSKNHRGYVPASEQGFYSDEGARNYEAFDLSLDLDPADPDSTPDKPLNGPNCWPDQSGFRRTIGQYYDAISAVGGRLAQSFEAYFDAPDTLTSLMQKPTSQLRLLHYFETDPPEEADVMNMGAHTDYECFTILQQGGPGLEVMNRDGQWIAAPPIDGAFAVNIGDMLEVWSNGVFRSTPHRVIHNGAERYSFPYFAAADFDAMVKPLPHLVHQHGERHRPIHAGHHLLGQLLRDFPYLRDRHQGGRLLDELSTTGQNPFEVEKLKGSATAQAA